MIRTSKHSLKFTNVKKLSIINMFYEDYKLILQHYINLILKGDLPFKIHEIKNIDKQTINGFHFYIYLNSLTKFAALFSIIISKYFLLHYKAL